LTYRRNFQPFMELEGSLPPSQEPATESYSELVQSTKQPHNMFP